MIFEKPTGLSRGYTGHSLKLLGSELQAHSFPVQYNYSEPRNSHTTF